MAERKAAGMEEEIAAGIPEEEMAAEEVGTAEEPTETEAELAAGGGFDVSIEQEPTLAGKRVGDTITFAIREISDDGNTFKLAVTEEPGLTPETAPGGAAPTGQEAITRELLGGA